MTAVHIYAPRPVETDMEARQWNAKAFNFPEYFAALQRAMQARNATPADVSRATGVSATTLTRMKEGRRPDAASLAALSAWAGLNPAAYVKASPATADFDLPAQSDEVAAQPTELEELRKLVKDFPLNDRDVPIIYDTNEIDLITYALTGDDGEDDSVTVLQRLVRALPGKTVYNLLEEAETAAQPQQAKPLSDAEFALNMLEMMFTAYENGTPCYEDPEDEVGFMGYAFRLADDDFKNIGDFLNRVRPVQSCIKEQG